MDEQAGFDQVVDDIYAVLAAVALALSAGVPEHVALTMTVDAAATATREFAAVNHVMRQFDER